MLKTAPVFSHHMVLQRNKEIRVFGFGESNREIEVTLGMLSAKTVCDDGKWLAILPEMPAQDGLQMVITDGFETIQFDDIAVGEVWLAGGQSNMELELQNADEGSEILNSAEEIKACKSIRYYYAPKVAYDGEELRKWEEHACWECFEGKNAACWSAVGFFFAKKLSEELPGITIGIIGCNWGGTTASCWMSRDSLLECEETACFVNDYENNKWVQKSQEEQKKDYKEYLKYHADWEARAAELYAKEPMMPFDEVQKRIGECRYPGPMNCVNFTRPSGLYESMLRKLVPYSMQGVLYYQGESDENTPEKYETLLTRLINLWREDFMDDSLYFLNVQLPMHRYQHDPDTKSWCIIREAQMNVFNKTQNSGLAVIIDLGQFHEIHPRKKRPVGERLALQALWKAYRLKEEQEVFGPIFKQCTPVNDEVGKMEIELEFAFADDGFLCEGEPVGFEVAGEDKIFCDANAKPVDGRKNVLRIYSDQVSRPVYVRYLWTNYGEVNLFGKNGLPVAPFRTDNV